MTHILWLSEPKEWQQNQNFHSLTVCWNRSGNKRFRLQKPPLCNYAITNHRIESVAHGGLQDREQDPFKSRYTVKLKVVTCKAAYFKNISCVFTSQTVTGCKNLWGKCIRSFDSLVVDMVAMIRTIMQEAAWTVCIKVMLSVFAFFFALHRWMQRTDSGDLWYQSGAHPSYGGPAGSPCSLQVMKIQTHTQRRIITGVKTTSSPKPILRFSQDVWSGPWDSLQCSMTKLSLNVY